MLLDFNGLVPHRFPHQSTAFLGKNSIYIVFNELACDLFSPCLRHDRLRSCAPATRSPRPAPQLIALECRTMVRFNPKGHSQPDRLKTIQPAISSACWNQPEYLETRGLSLPREDELEIDYMKLAGILAVPTSGWTPAS